MGGQSSVSTGVHVSAAMPALRAVSRTLRLILSVTILFGDGESVSSMTIVRLFALGSISYFFTRHSCSSIRIYGETYQLQDL